MLGKLDKQKLCNLIIFGVMLAISLCLGNQAWADDDSIIDNVRDRAVAVIEAVKPVVYTLGGFGLICVAWGAIFGKLNWKWFANLAIGLFLIAYMGMLIDYVTRSRGGTDTQDQFSTTHIINPDVFADTIDKESRHDSGRFVSLELEGNYYDFEDTATAWGNQEGPNAIGPDSGDDGGDEGDDNRPPYYNPDSLWGGRGPSPFIPPQ